MKRLFSIILALVLTLSIGTVAFAAGADGGTDMKTVTITKNYERTNEGTYSPAETFRFEISPTSVTDAAEGVTVDNMPVPQIGEVSYAAGEAGSENKSKEITVTLPEYSSVGIYTYTIKEIAGTNAGVTYYPGDIKLVVTVQQSEDGRIRVAAVHTEGEGEDKSDHFPNVYSAGALQISKTVTGNLGDQSKYFQVTVTLTGETGKTYADSYAVTGGSYDDNPDSIKVGETANFYLKHGDTITIENLPYGVIYTVVEADYTGEGYDEAKYDFSDGNKKIDSALDSVGITNHKEAGVDTGIILDSLPYVLLLAGAFIGVAFFFSKKRVVREN